MTAIDTTYVPQVVINAMTAQFDTDLAVFYDIEDPDHVNRRFVDGAGGRARPRLPAVEFQFAGGIHLPETVGAMGANLWDEIGTFQYHVVIHRNAAFQLARQIDSAVMNIFLRKEIEGVFFNEAMTPDIDLVGEGLIRGQSRVISYSYEYEHY